MNSDAWRRRKFLAATGAALSAGLGGCIGGDQTDPEPAETPETTPPRTDTQKEKETSHDTATTEPATENGTEPTTQEHSDLSFKPSSDDITEHVGIESLDWNGFEITVKEPSRYDVLVTSFKYDQNAENATINLDSGEPQLFIPGYDTDKQLPLVFNQQMLDEGIDIRFPTNDYMNFLNDVWTNENSDKELGDYTGEKLSYNEPLPEPFYEEHETDVYAGVADLTQFPPVDDLLELNVFLGNNEYRTQIGANVIDYSV